MGYSAGDKQKASTTPQIPPELRQLYRQVTDVAGSNIPAFKGLLSAGVSGDRSAAAPYAAPVAGSYTAMAPAYSGVRGTYTPVADTYGPLRETYTLGAGTQALLEPSYQRGVKAAIAPYQLQMQQAQDALRRRTPTGGGQTAALAQLLQGMGVNIGAAQSAVAQKDVDALNALRQQDITTGNALRRENITNLNQLAQQDAAARTALRVKDL